MDRFNIFDAVVVLVSYLELALSGSSALSAFRCVRLARVFKMAKSWESLRLILETILDTLPAMAYLSVLLLLFMFIASIGGMQILGGKMASERSNFNNFGIAMLTVFQMLTGENWNEVLDDCPNPNPNSRLDPDPDPDPGPDGRFSTMESTLRALMW